MARESASGSSQNTSPRPSEDPPCRWSIPAGRLWRRETFAGQDCPVATADRRLEGLLRMGLRRQSRRPSAAPARGVSQVRTDQARPSRRRCFSLGGRLSPSRQRSGLIGCMGRGWPVSSPLSEGVESPCALPVASASSLVSEGAAPPAGAKQEGRSTAPRRREKQHRAVSLARTSPRCRRLAEWLGLLPLLRCRVPFASACRSGPEPLRIGPQ